MDRRYGRPGRDAAHRRPVPSAAPAPLAGHRCCGYFEERLGLPLDTYAFPNGSHRPEQVELLASRGFRHILLVEEKYGTRGARVLPRFTIGGASCLETRFQALGYKSRGVL